MNTNQVMQALGGIQVSRKPSTTSVRTKADYGARDTSFDNVFAKSKGDSLTLQDVEDLAKSAEIAEQEAKLAEAIESVSMEAETPKEDKIEIEPDSMTNSADSKNVSDSEPDENLEDDTMIKTGAVALALIAQSLSAETGLNESQSDTQNIDIKSVLAVLLSKDTTNTDLQSILPQSKELAGKSQEMLAMLSGRLVPKQETNLNLNVSDLKNLNLKNLELNNLDLKNLGLNGADLENLNLKTTDLKDLNLDSENLKNLDLKDSDVNNLNLKNLSLKSSALNNLNLKTPDLKDSNLENLNLKTPDLKNADVENLNLKNLDLKDLEVNNLNLKTSDLKNSESKNLNLKNLVLKDSDLDSENLKTPDLKDSNLENLNLKTPNLKDSEVNNLNLKIPNLKDSEVENLNLKTPNLKDSKVNNLNLKTPNLKDSEVNNLNLKTSNLKNSELDNLNLKNLGLKDLKLDNLNLKNLSLKDLDLENLNLKDLSLKDLDLDNLNLKNLGLNDADLENLSLGKFNINSLELKDLELPVKNLLKSIGRFVIESKVTQVFAQTQSMDSLPTLAQNMVKSVAVNDNVNSKLILNIPVNNFNDIRNLTNAKIVDTAGIVINNIDTATADIVVKTEPIAPFAQNVKPTADNVAPNSLNGLVAQTDETEILPIRTDFSNFEQNANNKENPSFAYNSNKEFMSEKDDSQKFGNERIENNGQFAHALESQNSQHTTNVRQSAPTTALPRDNYNVQEQIVQQARLIRAENGSEMVIRLKPEHLGDMTLRISVSSEGAVTASFFTNNAEVRHIVENSLVQLRQELQNQGIKVDKTEVYSGLSDGNLPQGQGQEAWQQNQSRNSSRSGFINSETETAQFEDIQTEPSNPAVVAPIVNDGVNYLV